jgi:uncharacterized membrane protein
MGRVSFKGVALGVLVDIGGTVLASMLLLSWFVGDTIAPEMPPEEVEQIMRQLSRDGAFLTASLVLGLAFTGLGGYVAARVATRELYLNAGLVGVVSLVLGLVFGGQAPLWFEVAGVLLIVPAALYGGYLADRQLNP